MKKTLLTAFLAAATPAAAHDWYPIECCHMMDCAPVESVEMIPPQVMTGMFSAPTQTTQTVLGALIVTATINGLRSSAVVPPDFPRQESKDHRMHACMRPTGSNGTFATGGQMQLICIFMPPAM